jgi:hypothetical protein
VNAAVGGTIHLHAAVEGAAIALRLPGLRSGALRLTALLTSLRFLPLLPLPSLCPLLTRPSLLRGFCLLGLLCRPRIAPVISEFLLILLGSGKDRCAEEQRQDRCTDDAGFFHLGKLL